MKRVSCVVLAIAVVAVVAVVLMRPRGAKVSEGTAVAAQAVAETAGSMGVARQIRDSAAVPAARSISGDSSVSSFPASTTYDPSFPKSRQVLLANRRIVLEDGRAFPKRFAAAQSPTARGTAPYVVIGEAPVSREMRVRVSENGARVIGFLPDNAMLVEADEPSLRRLEEDGLFAAAVEYEPADKIQRHVFESAGETVEVTVVMMNVADNASVRSFVTANGGKLISDTTNGGETLYVEMPTAMVGRLAAMAEVKWIENYGHLKLCNDQAVLPQVMNVTPVWSSCGLTGEGQVIATLDSGIDTGNLDTLNADFGGQIVEIAQFSSGDKADYTGHGTHTAGSIAGTGANSDDKFKGVAHGAKLLIQSGSSEQQTFHPYHEKGVREWFTYKRKEVGYGVRSDSWGNANHGVYNDRCRLCDDCIWNDPELLEVVAVGNEGGSFSPDSSVNDPASSKNVLAVGATGNRRFYAKDEPNDNNINDISTYSSLGPTADGRIKPDVCAPGEFVVSVASSKAIYGAYFDASQKYAYNSGSSMATPLTAGCAALVREWLMKYKGYAETKPTAALMKAVLMGGATDISENSWMGWLYGAPPSNFQGWGRINLGESIFPTGGLGVYLKDRLPFVSGTNFVFTVATTNAASLRAQLVWIDYPAEEGAAVAIVNDLDLSVENAAKTKWFGNGGSAADDRNTVESVRIEEAAAGTYKVTVSCSKIVYDHTKGGAAAIYIRGAFDPATVTMNGGVPVPPTPVVHDSIPHLTDTTAVSTEEKVDYIVRSANALMFGNATKRFEFADGCDIVAPRFVLGNNDYTVQHVRQTGGRVTITGTGDATSTTDCPVLLGHWKGTDRSYVMTGGEFYATNGITRLGWDGGCTLKIGGGAATARMRLKGLKAGGERFNAGSSLTVQPNGVLEVGASGLNVLTANIPVTLEGGTLSAYENAEVNVAGGISLTADSAIDVPAGVTMRLKSGISGNYKIEKRGAGTLYVTDESLIGKFTVVEGEVAVYLTEAEKAAKLSPSKPVILFDAGTSVKPAIADDWQVHLMNDTKTYSVTCGGVTVSGSTSAKFWKNSTTATFAAGSFTDVYGKSWPNVEGEMLVSLGLKGTREANVASFFQTGSNVGNGGGTSITVAGLNTSKRYVLYYMTCDGSNSKPSSFKLKSGGYEGAPIIDSVQGLATGYAPKTVGTAITASANVPLLVRVSDLKPNAQGKVVIDVGGATVNVLAIAEMPDPSLFYIALGRYLPLKTPFQRP